MYIPYVNTQNYPSVDYNQCLKRMDTKFNKPTNEKVPKVIKPMNKKILETLVINSSVSLL